MTVIALGCGKRLIPDKYDDVDVGDVEVLLKLKLFKSDEMESVEIVEEDERDIEWREEEDDELLLERERKVVFERLKI